VPITSVTRYTLLLMLAPFDQPLVAPYLRRFRHFPQPRSATSRMPAHPRRAI
jgi:hypothetical protein